MKRCISQEEAAHDSTLSLCQSVLSCPAERSGAALPSASGQRRQLANPWLKRKTDTMFFCIFAKMNSAFCMEFYTTGYPILVYSNGCGLNALLWVGIINPHR